MQVELQKDQKEFKVGDEVIPLQSAYDNFGFSGDIGVVYVIQKLHYSKNYKRVIYRLKDYRGWVRDVDIVLKSSLILELL
jgi:hypothetical protein